MIGAIPTGVPRPRWLYALGWENVIALLPGALVIATVSFIESMAVAKKFAGK